MTLNGHSDLLNETVLFWMFRSYLDSPTEIRNDAREVRQLIRRLRRYQLQAVPELAERQAGGLDLFFR